MPKKGGGGEGRGDGGSEVVQRQTEATSPSEGSGQGRCLFGLSIHSAMLQGDWNRLYASSIDGLHFQQLAHALVGYDGPTVLLLQDEAGAVFGAFALGSGARHETASVAAVGTFSLSRHALFRGVSIQSELRRQLHVSQP